MPWRRSSSIPERSRWQRSGLLSTVVQRRWRAGRRDWEHPEGLGWRVGWCGFGALVTSCLEFPLLAAALLDVWSGGGFSGIQVRGVRTLQYV